MTLPRSNVVLMVFYDGHSADAIYTLGTPQGEQRMVCFFAFALSDFLLDVVVHFITPRQKYPV